MTKRTLQPAFGILALLLLASILVACSQPTPAPTPQPAAATDVPAAGGEEPVATEAPLAAEEPAPTDAAPTEEAAPALSGEISFYIWQNSPGMDKLVGEDLPRMFEAKHPGTKINASVLPWDQFNTKVALLVSAGTPPDIFESGPDFMRYVTEGVVIPLDDRFAADPILSNAELSRVEANDFMKADRQHIYGTQFGSICGMQLYYNKDLFDKAGVAYPNEDWTWDDYRAAAKELTIEENGETVQWGTTWGYLGGWDGGWAPLVWDSGGEYFDSPFQTKEVYFDRPEVIAAWQFMQDLVYKDKVAPNNSTLDVLNQAGGALLSGKVAMLVDGCWMMQAYKGGDFELGMTVLPKGPAGRVNAGWFAGGMAIAKASKYPDLAWEYLRWLAVDEEANKALASIGMSCGAPIVKAYDDLYATSWAEIEGGDACTKSLDNVRAATIWADAWGETWTNTISPAWDRFVNGEITAQEFSDLINKPANDALSAAQ